MSILLMDVYVASTGVQMTIALESDSQYEQVKNFLTGMEANSSPAEASDRKKPEFFYLQDQKQFDTLCEFLRSLKEKADGHRNGA